MRRRQFWIGAAALGALLGLVVGLPAMQSGLALAGGAPRVLDPEQLRWARGLAVFPPGAEITVLDGSPERAAPFLLRMRVPRGYAVKPYLHGHDEHITVISGRWAVGVGERFDPARLRELGPGGYAKMPAGEPHFSVAREDSVLQISATGKLDVRYVQAGDDPRR